MRSLLSALLLVTGLGWAAMGVGNVWMAFDRGESDQVMTLALLVNSIGFVLPGLMVAGIGSMVGRR